jgi:hypothetical protein
MVAQIDHDIAVQCEGVAVAPQPTATRPSSRTSSTAASPAVNARISQPAGTPLAGKRAGTRSLTGTWTRASCSVGTRAMGSGASMRRDTRGISAGGETSDSVAGSLGGPPAPGAPR